MSYLVLARKYRPQTFEEVVGQHHVTQTLANAITSQRVAHAILFSGPRGTGKTTVARILAKAMNCADGPTPTPCNQCRSCTEITAGNSADVFEIDGASNNSVDQIRDLRENSRYMPSGSRHKIYIIDEVHMLSISAFNALLKTLEEPPAHVMFFFATTEPHKIPATILSRCQRHDFKKIEAKDVSGHLRQLCEKEGREADAESLALITHEAGGCMRDALSLLDQLLASVDGPLTAERVIDILGVIDRKIVFDLAEAVLHRDLSAVLTLIDAIDSRGHDVKKTYAELIEHFRNLAVVKVAKDPSGIVDVPEYEIDRIRAQAENFTGAQLTRLLALLFKEEAAVRMTRQPRLAMEMVFFQLLQVPSALSIDTLIEKMDGLRRQIGAGGIPFSGDQDISDHLKKPSGGHATAPIASSAVDPQPDSRKSVAGAPGFGSVQEKWKRALDVVSESHPFWASNLEQGEMEQATDNEISILVSANKFTVKKLRKNLEDIRNICSRETGLNVRIEFTDPAERESVQEEKEARSDLKKKILNDPLVAEALEVFEGTLININVSRTSLPK